METRMETSLTKNELNNYKMLDVMKYIAAIMVICIHCNQLFLNEYIDFFVRQIVCRIAVPFFFISSAYFVRKGCQSRPDYLKAYLKKLIKSYLAWSLVFIPIGLDWIYQNLNLSGDLLPFALIIGLIHIGTYYHLWYIPAMIFAIYIVDQLLKHISYKQVFILSVCLFLFGSIETYYGLLPNNWFKDFFDILIKVIFTTRSGLFYGLIFVSIGFYISDYQDKLKSIKSYITKLTLLFGGLLIIEGLFLYNIIRLDMNFLIMLIPFSFFFFLWILSLSYIPRNDTRKIRELSKYYYFIHPVCIVIVEEFGKAYHLSFLSSGIISLLFVIVLTHVLCSIIIVIHQYPIMIMRIVLASLGGVFITLMLAGMFFQFKNPTILVKFEFVPCLWFFSSFCIYYAISQCKHQSTIKSHI